MPSLKHIHTYIRWRKRGEEMWWRCADPNCSHILPQSQMAGKTSLCFSCGSEVIMDWKQYLRRVKATCLNCQDTVEGRAFKENKKKAEALMDILNIGAAKEDLQDA